ncbi:MAG TPA: efflux RND transporter periplasmic adaptor subunit [Cyclobacteriaceae bacterium]|nr:efflux RND transporter periplasmic adaptor subunit [Cyclobacteriaceae bacterium]
MKLNKLNHIVMLFAGILAGCASGGEDPQEESPIVESSFELSPEQKALADITTGHLEYRLISGVIACTGEIDVPPEGRASVSAPSGGFISENTLMPGAYVKKGQRLARLTNPDYVTLQQQYLETLGELGYAEQDYSRQKTLEEKNATALKKLQQSESVYQVLKARLAGLKTRLEMIGIDIKSLENGSIQSGISIRAPISGYVATANFAQGAFVEARETIFEIVNMDELHVQLNVFEQHISSVARDQVIRFRPSGSAKSYLGKVHLISPERNVEGRTFSVHGHIDNPGSELKTGMYVEADILITADSLPALPEQALVYQNSKPFVLIERGGDYELQPVDTGRKMEGWIEIRNPEALMQRNIVTQGASRLFAEMRR